MDTMKTIKNSGNFRGDWPRSNFRLGQSLFDFSVNSNNATHGERQRFVLTSCSHICLLAFTRMDLQWYYDNFCTRYRRKRKTMQLSNLSNLQKLKSNRNTFLRKRKSKRKSQKRLLHLPRLPRFQQIRTKTAILLHQRKNRQRLILEHNRSETA